MRSAVATTVRNSSAVKNRGSDRGGQTPGDHLSRSCRSTTGLPFRQHVVAREAGARSGVRHRDGLSSIPMRPDLRERDLRNLGVQEGEDRSARSGSSCASRPCFGTRHRRESRRPRRPSPRAAASTSARTDDGGRGPRQRRRASSAAAIGGSVTGNSMNGL